LINELRRGKTPNLVYYSACFTGYIVYDLGLMLLYRNPLLAPSAVFHHVLLCGMVVLANAFDVFYGLGA
jgi:hypothetical protein